MINSKAELKEWLLYERKLYLTCGKLKGAIKYVCGSERGAIWHFQKCLRKTEYYHNTGKMLRYYVSRLRLNRLRNRYGFNIPINVCERGLHLMHIGPVLMNGGARIGRDVSIHINTSFVAHGLNAQAPKVGNGVVVGVGAVILGGCSIADNVAVGANAVVNRDVLEENIAVAGVPAKKISNHGRLEWKKIK